MPWPTPLVVKNGSKMRSRFSGGMRRPCPRWRPQRNRRAAAGAPHGGDAHRPIEADAKVPLSGHGIARIDDEIDERRIELARIGIHVQIALLFAGKIEGDVHPCAGQRAHHVGHCRHRTIHREGLGSKGLSTGEGKQLAGELGRPFDRVGDCPDIALATFLREARPLQQIGRGLDDGQQVVEVVRYAARQLADGFQLL